MNNDSSLIEKPRGDPPKAEQQKPRMENRWTQPLGVRLRGLVLAREKNWLLTWDENNWLHLMGRNGERQGQVRTPGAMSVACCADDGSAYAAAGAKGEVWWLAPDLSVRWERAVPKKVVAAALDSFGQYLAIADARGNLHVFDRFGKTVCHDQTPRPLHHLTFVPAAPFLLGSADYGLVVCYDLSCRPVWRDGPVSHVGALAVSGDGEQVVLACFTEGLQRYDLTGKNLGRQTLVEPCRLVSLSYDGKSCLVAGLTNRLHLLDRDGQALGSHQLEKPATAVALAPLADSAYVALADGTVHGLDLREAPRS